MYININNYEHFSFDLWLTIIKSNPDFKLKRDTLLKDYFSIDKSLEEVRKVIRYYDVLYNKVSEKTGNHVTRHEIFFVILNALGKNIDDINSDELKAFLNEMDNLFLENQPVLLWENIEKELSEIKNEGKTANILSNTAFIHGDSLRKVLDHLGLSKYFSFMIFSDEVGFSKPNPKVFDLVFEEANQLKKLSKKEILHIGDNKKADYEGALQYGNSALLVKI